MQNSCWRFNLIVISLWCILFSWMSPDSGRALNPLDDQALIEYSPSTLEPLEEIEQDIRRNAGLEFNRFCFQKCHQPSDFSPTDRTRKQWLLLIGENGHAVFEKIEWEDSDQRETILFHLLDHAKNADAGAEGIGLWEQDRQQ